MAALTLIFICGRNAIFFLAQMARVMVAAPLGTCPLHIKGGHAVPLQRPALTSVLGFVLALLSSAAVLADSTNDGPYTC